MTLSEKLRWNLRRLRSMNLPEVIHRVKQLTQSKLESFGIGLASSPPPDGASGQQWCKSFTQNVDTVSYSVQADRILDGKFDIFNLHNIDLGFPPQWNLDCRTNTLAPQVFGKTLNYRDEKIVGDIKYLWEPNRHVELVTLAQAFYLTKNLDYAKAIQSLLLSWFEQCPYPLGANWTSSLEHAVRLVNWSFTWHLIGGENAPLFQTPAGEKFRLLWLDSIYKHCHFIASHFSKYSSANNHLLGEYMGLLVGSLTWPMWKESSAWRALAQRGFEAEALLQNTSDGVNREQATWYHHEVADMLLICGLVGKANGIEFSKDYWLRLEAMLAFIAAIMDAGGNVPMIGDADDAVMVRFSREADFQPFRSLLATGAVLFNRSDFKAKAGKFDDKSRWLLGDEGERLFSEIPTITQCAPPTRAFKEGGYYIMGDNWASENEIHLVADVGELGYLSIAAHGHADALAFTLSLGGMEMLIDPGTYAYHTQKKWRDYFRGTSAHNTVRIDELDQSVIGGNFLWLKHAQARLTVWDIEGQQERLVGSHDGYWRLPDSVLHTREIAFDKTTRSIKVRDVLKCLGKHTVELHWHCHEDAEVSIKDSIVKIVRGKQQISLSLADPKFVVRLAKGEENPPLGWISRTFDCKTPTTTVVWVGEIQGEYVIESNLALAA